MPAQLLQPASDLAQTPIAVAVLPALVPRRRHRPPREHHPLRQQQLEHARLLALLAPQLLPLVPPLHLPAARRVEFRECPRRCTLHLHIRPRLHLRRPLARYPAPPAHLGLAHRLLHVARDGGGLAVPETSLGRPPDGVSHVVLRRRRREYTHDDGR